MSLIEFAFIIPILVLVFIPGSWELTNALLAKRKASNATTVMADLITQSGTINTTSYEKIEDFVRKVLYPYDDMEARFRVVGLNVDNRERVTTTWSFGKDSLKIDDLPDRLIMKNSFYVVAVSELDYTVSFLSTGVTDMTFHDTAVMVPRLTATIAKIGN